MSEQVLTLLVQIPLAGVVVFVVIVFLNYLSKADERNKNFISEQRKDHTEAMKSLATEIKCVTTEVAGLKSLMIAHQAQTETAIHLNSSERSKTQPPRRKNIDNS